MVIVLTIIAIAGLGLARSQIRTAGERAGLVMGSAVDAVSDAVNEYRTKNVAALTAAVPTVVGFANAMAPTLTELKAAGYLNVNVSNTLGDYGAYSVAITKSPLGCVGPSSTCNVWSRIHLANPIVEKGTGQPDVSVLSALISRIKESASYSTQPTPATIVGGNGAWSIPNPDGTNRVGMFVVVAGLGGVDGAWLRVQDPRNPDFRGPSVTAIQFDTLHKVIGQACTPQGAFASAANGMAYCNAGVWVLYNGAVATPGGACTTDGAMGHSAAGASLLCVGGLWRDHLTYGFQSPGYYAHNDIVPQPACGTGLTPRAVISSVSASVIIGANNPGNNTGSFQADINASTWRVRIIGSDGSQAGTNARALVTTFCAVT
ncbi:MAG: hypothetical protein HYX47_13375 [Burkholderiales bacterium]|nr:hypothetical protein [Burkholderiales bacterium]